MEIDSRTGMKVSTKLTGDGIRIDVVVLRTTWPLKMVAGILPLRLSVVLSAGASRKAAAQGVGTELSFGKLTDFLARVSIPSRTSLLIATGLSLLCISLVTKRSSVMSATTVGVPNGGLNPGKLTFSFQPVSVNSPNGRVPPIVTGTFGGADFFHSLLGETTE